MGDVTVHASGTPVQYDALDNTLRPVSADIQDGKTVLHLELAPLQLMIISFGGEEADALVPTPCGHQHTALGGFTVTKAESKAYPAFSDPVQMDSLTNMGRLYPDFSGYYRYETKAELKPGRNVLAIADCYEAAEVFVNGKSAGIRFAAPYRFDISALVQDGVNEIAIEVATTLERKVAAMNLGGHSLMGKNPVSPTGIVGEVWIENE